MRRTRSELLDAIRLGEDGLLELKDTRFSGGKLVGPSQDNLADELTAFANSDGGELVLGVNDQREVVGVPLDQLDAVETLLRQACLQSIKPPLAPLIERIQLPDDSGEEWPVVRVSVARSLFVHLGPGGYLHRVGSAKQVMPPDYLARLLQQRSQSRLIRFDETAVQTATLQDLDPALWQRFAPDNTTDEPSVLLAKLAMARQGDDGRWHPTVAGLLMGCDHAAHYLPGAFVQAVAYAGTGISPDEGRAYQRDAKDITGPLDQQIRNACAFVRKNMRVAARKTTAGGREDIPQFDMLAVFEAITNAVAHRDYSMAGAKVRLRLFDDRLELYTPGLLPNTMTTDSLPYRQAARNEALTSLLARCPVDDESLPVGRRFIMDKRGEGVPIILARSRRRSGRTPEYSQSDASELVLTIFGAGEQTA